MSPIGHGSGLPGRLLFLLLSQSGALLVSRRHAPIFPPSEDCHVDPACEHRPDKCTCAPNLFLIGMPRSASTSFFLDVKKLLPDIDVGENTPFVSFHSRLMGSKQKCYFDYVYCVSPDLSLRSAEYAHYLDLWHRHAEPTCKQSKERIRTDFSVTYMSDLLVPHRIHDLYKQAPLTPNFLVLLREPTRRYLSEVRHWNATKALVRVGIPHSVEPSSLTFEQFANYQLKHYRGCMPAAEQIGSKFADAVKRCTGGSHVDGLPNGMYSFLLEHWTHHFRPSQFMVVSFTSYLKRTAATMRTIMARLVPSSTVPAQMTASDYVKDHLKGERTDLVPDPEVMRELGKFYAPYNQHLRSFLARAQKEGLRVVGGVDAIFEG